MKLILVFAICWLLLGCESTDYYFTVENEKEVTGLLLYSDDQITLYYKVYNGLISTLRFNLKKTSEDSTVEVVKYEHFLLLDNKKFSPSIIHDQGVGEIRFNNNLTASITSSFVFEENPNALLEVIIADIKVDGRLIKINRELSLTKDSFTYLDALLNI